MKSNTICDYCGTDFYKRPSHKKKSKNNYCSRRCYYLGKTNPDKSCAYCEGGFHPKKPKQKYCSRRCAALSTRKPWSTTKKKDSYKSHSEHRLAKLNSVFDFASCMVEGCDYNKTYDVHRFIPGKDGGTYTIGNMFAICPNHHAEITRGISRAEKISDCIIRVTS